MSETHCRMNLSIKSFLPKHELSCPWLEVDTQARRWQCKRLHTWRRVLQPHSAVDCCSCSCLCIMTTTGRLSRLFMAACVGTCGASINNKTRIQLLVLVYLVVCHGNKHSAVCECLYRWFCVMATSIQLFVSACIGGCVSWQQAFSCLWLLL